MGQLLETRREGAVSVITLNDGKANALSPDMLGQINAALDQAQADGTVVLLTGRPGMFSGGFDLNVFKQGGQAPLDMLRAGGETAYRLLAFPAPVVIAVTGHAIAMGVFLMMGGDVRIGVSDKPAKIWVNESQIGMTLPYFAIELCRQRLDPVTFNRALITAEPHTPEQAVTAGFLDSVAPADSLLTVALEKATQLSTLSRDAYVGTKARLRANALQALRAALDADAKNWGSGKM